ncbi:MAG: hypothetical protein NVSMB29_16180 [Candidatus Dormibacteria bacterium]
MLVALGDHLVLPLAILAGLIWLGRCLPKRNRRAKRAPRSFFAPSLVATPVPSPMWDRTLRRVMVARFGLS